MRKTIEGVAMKMFAAITVIAAIALGASQALAAGSTTPKTLKVVMADPGCHWFLVNGKDRKTASMSGPIRLKNLDEAALMVASRTGMRHVRVGAATLLHRGHYVVMMVGQAPDDNHLMLTVR
jgi:acyl-coenzyme A synthetase/AMP-(fatty) acid ligase